MIPPLHAYTTILNCGPFFSMHLELLMAVIFIWQLHWKNVMLVEIAKGLSHRTVCSVVLLTCFSLMHLLDGRDQLLMLDFMKKLSQKIGLYLMDGIFLQMLAFHIALNFWFLIIMSVTIWQNGVRLSAVIS